MAAAIYVAAGLPRLVVGVALMLVSPTEAVAMLGVAIAAFAPAIVGWWGLREPRRDDGELDAEHRPANIIRETLHNSQALFAFFALSSVDVIVARNVLDPHDAGLYAGGLILTKATLFLPQFIVVVAFPALSTEQDRRHALTRSLTLLAVLGAAVTAGVWLMPDLALVFIGGHEFAAIADRLWLFAVIGMLLSALQLLVYAVLARRGQRAAYLLWGGLAALVGLGVGTHTINGLIAVVVAVDAALLAMLVVISLYLVRSPEDASSQPQ